MENYPESMKTLIESFKLLPGIGEKTAERLVYHILDIDDEQIETFAKSLINVKEKIKKCEICNNITETKICSICANPDRDNVICVVENPKNIMMIEKLDIYQGKYHCLNGLISPLDGINIEDINIESLIGRFKKDNIDELIFALKPGVEGDVTVMYISKLVEEMDINVSKLAQGLPMGADMEYIDSLTMEMALKNRKKIE